MQVILLDMVENLGKLGDVVNVKPGYGRNYLVPQGKALTATKANLARFEARRAELEQHQADVRAAAEARAQALGAVEVTIARKVGEEGKLYGSVGPQDIADAICEQGQEVQRSEVRLPDGPLRHTGEHEVAVHLHADVTGTVKVQIVPE